MSEGQSRSNRISSNKMPLGHREPSNKIPLGHIEPFGQHAECTVNGWLVEQGMDPNKDVQLKRFAFPPNFGPEGWVVHPV